MFEFQKIEQWRREKDGERYDFCWNFIAKKQQPYQK